MKVLRNKAEEVEQLRKQILAMQGLSRPDEIEPVSSGLPAIDAAFPNRSFPVGAVHEFTSTALEDGAATNGFLVGLIGCLTQAKGVCLWISSRTRVFPPALKVFGVHPDQIVFVDALRDKDALWTIEEALKCKALSAVVGEIGDLDFTASRRLQLAVENSRVTGFIHRRQPKSEAAIACVSRWEVTRLASETADSAPGLGLPRWNVNLRKVRNGQPGRWQVEWTPTGFRQVLAFPQATSMPVYKTGS